MSLKDDLLNRIRLISEDKKARHIWPEYALKIEFQDEFIQFPREDIIQALKELKSENKIKYGPTINDTYYQLL